MKVRQLTYGVRSPYGQGSEERLEITLAIESEEDVQSALLYAKQFILTNVNSLDEYAQLGEQIQKRKQELSEQNTLVEKANEEIEKLDNLIQTHKREVIGE